MNFFKKQINKIKNSWLKKLLFPIIGLLSLIWFLIRVIPKPSRVTYPCQMAAFPIASNFLIWLLGLGTSSCLLSGSKLIKKLKNKNKIIPVLCIISVLYFGLYFQNCDISGDISSTVVASSSSESSSQSTSISSAKTIKTPIGTPKGIFPGRVVWVHNPDATSWDGVGPDYWWEPENTSRTVVNEMVKKAVCNLTNETSDIKKAWESIFKYYNKNHRCSDAGYTAGEKIVIKVNFVGSIAVWGNIKGDPNYPNTSPQIIHAVLEQLVKIAGVSQNNITVGDPTCKFPDEFYKYLHGDFPDVNYLCYGNELGRVKATLSSIPFHWSTPDASGKVQDYVPKAYADATYLINIANLKGHFDQAGISLCGKNHYGSLARNPSGKGGYYNLHKNLPMNNSRSGIYSPIVDLMGYKYIGGKTLIYLIDGLYACRHQAKKAGNIPVKWKTEPFNNDWTSSIFSSLDPVAIDSVGFDFLASEWPENPGPASPGTDNYLIEAALANNPPSGTFYNPNDKGSAVHLKSLGVYEHWNNANDKKYSGNLGKQGIELIQIKN